MKLDKEWQKIHAMDEGELADFAEKHAVELEDKAYSLDEARDAVCRELDIEPENSDDDPGNAIDRAAGTIQRERPDKSYAECLSLARKKYPITAQRELDAFPNGLYKRGRKS